MFRQLLEEAFEEFRQTVAPARPEISTPLPNRNFRPLPQPHQAEMMIPEETAAPVARTVSSPPAMTQRAARVSPLRAQLSSPASVRSAFRIMEVLGPPVALRDPLDRVQDR